MERKDLKDRKDRNVRKVRKVRKNVRPGLALYVITSGQPAFALGASVYAWLAHVSPAERVDAGLRPAPVGPVAQ